MMAEGRNAPCPCGSGLKRKRCCAEPARLARERAALDRIRRDVLADALAKRAEEDRRRGRPRTTLVRTLLAALAGI